MTTKTAMCVCGHPRDEHYGAGGCFGPCLNDCPCASFVEAGDEDPSDDDELIEDDDHYTLPGKPR